MICGGVTFCLILLSSMAKALNRNSTATAMYRISYFRQLTRRVSMESTVNLNCNIFVFLLILFGLFASNFSYDKWSEFYVVGEC